MDDSFAAQAEEWFERGRRDLDSARRLLGAGGYPDIVGMLIQQGLEKCLKGFLVRYGQRPRRTHDLSLLLGLAASYRSDLDQYEELCVTATAYYLEDRYPPGPAVPRQREDMIAALSRAQELAAKLTEQT